MSRKTKKGNIVRPSCYVIIPASDVTTIELKDCDNSKQRAGDLS